MGTLEAFLELQLRQLAPGSEPLSEKPVEVAKEVREYIKAVPGDINTVFEAGLDAIELQSDFHLISFSSASLSTRAKIIDELQSSAIAFPVVSVVARICWLVIYSRPWAREKVGFAVPTPTAPIQVDVPVNPPLDITYDVCVVGSGAGGAVVAAILAEAGKSVLILEEGSWRSPHALPVRDDRGLIELYRNAGIQPALPHLQNLPHTGISPINVLQARAVGGGPLVNNAIHLRMKETTWNEWATYGFPVGWKDLNDKYKAIADDLGIQEQNPEESNPAKCERSEYFMAGALAQGFSVDRFPVCVTGCLGCGGCNLGCRFGKKIAGIHSPKPATGKRSYLQRAWEAGAKIRSDIRVRAVDLSAGSTVKTLFAEDLRRAGAVVKIRAKSFVLSAGPIASSQILRRSGLWAFHPSNPVGQHVSANVVSPVFSRSAAPFGRAPDPGLQMCVYVNENGKLLLETWFHYPGSLAVALPGWTGDHAATLTKYQKLAVCGAVVPSGNSGFLSPVTQNLCLGLSDQELDRMVEGILQIAKVYLEHDAEAVLPSTQHPFIFTHGQFDSDAARFRKSIRNQADLGLATAHPQGGNRMGLSPSDSVVSKDFNVHGYDNLFVADASLFPAGCKVNPQMTTMALAHLAGDKVLSRMGP
jgi:choline dehydrogenase-like flavoprotein